jgi:hypothetical protein
MKQNNVTQKGLIVGIVLLFLTISFSPIINVDGNTVPQAIGDVPITFFECKADGTVKRTVFRMSPEQADSFHEEMANAQDLETKLSIYKKNNLISQDITVDTLQAEMQEKAQRRGLTQNGLISLFRIKRSPFPSNVYRNINCSVSGSDPTFDGFRFPIFRTGYLFNYISGSYRFESKGDLGEFRLEYPYDISLIGFVGIIEIGYHETWRWIEYSGFCVYAQAKSKYPPLTICFQQE